MEYSCEKRAFETVAIVFSVLIDDNVTASQLLPSAGIPVSNEYTCPFAPTLLQVFYGSFLKFALHL